MVSDCCRQTKKAKRLKLPKKLTRTLTIETVVTRLGGRFLEKILRHSTPNCHKRLAVAPMENWPSQGKALE